MIFEQKQGCGAAAPQRVHTDNAADIAEKLRRLPSAFPDALVELMKWRGCTVEALAEKALISRSTVVRLRNDVDYETNLELIIAICVALWLPPAIYTVLIQSAGYSFTASRRHVVYQQLLAQAYFAGMDVFQFNGALSEYGISLIGQET
jgi:DNA-binding XRE family transcriptional regulator